MNFSKIREELDNSNSITDLWEGVTENGAYAYRRKSDKVKTETEPTQEDILKERYKEMLYGIFASKVKHEEILRGYHNIHYSNRFVKSMPEMILLGEILVYLDEDNNNSGGPFDKDKTLELVGKYADIVNRYMEEMNELKKEFKKVNE